MDCHKNYILITGFLAVIFLTLPIASTENIDCQGKAFYCANSTHFKICVDFGGGVSKTVDNFLIPCPTNTVCSNSNIFECEQQITTTPVPIRSSDVTIEQTELDVLFPEYKTNVKEELKNYYDSSTTAIEYSTSGAFSDTTEYISSTILDGRFNKVNVSSESNMQNSERSDLSDSATVSFAPASAFGLLSTDNEYLTPTAKVTSKDYLLKGALDTGTTNSTDNFSLATTTVQIFEGVTERNVRLETKNSLDVNVSNNNEYNNSSLLLTQTDSVFTPSDIFVTYTETYLLNVTQDSNNYFKTVTTPSTLNIDNVANDSLIDSLNYDTTTNSYNKDEEQTTKSDIVLNSTYSYQLLSTGTTEPINNEDFNFTISSTFNVMDDVTMSTISPYTLTEYTENMSLSNIFNTNKNLTLDTNTTESSVQGIFKNKTVNLITESSTPYDSIDHLITSTIRSDYQQFFNNNNVTIINNIINTDLSENLTNNLADISPISDKSFTNSSTESIPTTLYYDSITDNLFNLTIVTNQSQTNKFLESSTSSDHLSQLTTSTTGSDYRIFSENNNVTVTNTTDLYENITNLILDTNTTETSVQGIFENKTENLIIESSTPYITIDHLITSTTSSDYRQFFNNNTVTVINTTTDLYENLTNNLADISPISDKSFTNRSTESNSTTLYDDSIATNIETNNFLESSTSSDHLSRLTTSTTGSDYRLFSENNNVTVTNTTDLYENIANNLAGISPISDKPFTYSSTESNPTTVYVDSITDNLINLTIVTNQSPTNNFLESSTSPDHLFFNSLHFNNDSRFKEDVTTNNLIEVNTYSDSTENYVPNVKNDSDFTGNKTISVISSTTIPILLNASETEVSDSYSSTTINYAPISEYNQPAISFNPETYQNQEIYSSSTRKSLSDFLNKTVSTTMIYYDRDVVTLENENKTLENMNITEVTQSEQYLVALINITGKNFDNLNIHTSPVTASTETMSMYPSTTQSYNESNTILRASNMTGNNNTVYSIKEQVPEIVIEKDFPQTQTNEVFNVSNKLNKTINYSFTNGGSATKTTLPLTKQELTTSKPYDNKTILDISINTIRTTDDAISVIDSNLSLTGNGESKDNVTTINIHSDLPYTHHNNTSETIQDFKLGNKEVVTDSPTLTKSISFPEERTGVTFDNIYYTNTLDHLSNQQNITQTTPYATITEKNNTDMLNTQNNYVNANNGQIGAENTLNKSINGTNTKNNSALPLQQNLTGRNNEMLIKNLESEPNRNMPPNNSVHIMNRDRQQEAQRNNTKVPFTPTITEARTQTIPSALDRNNQTTVFTCLNRDRGKYSDKSNCNKFYICIGKLQPIIGMCPADTVFSEINKQCTKNLSHCIRNNQFRCLSSGRFLDVLSDDFYYVCVKNLGSYVRFKLQCQRGYHLNRENIKCSSESISIESVSKTTSDKSTDEKRSKEIKHKEKYETQFDCEKEGKFEHPDDCRKYFVCTKSKSKFRRKVKKCDSDEVFNKEKRKCVDSESYEC